MTLMILHFDCLAGIVVLWLSGICLMTLMQCVVDVPSKKPWVFVEMPGTWVDL